MDRKEIVKTLSDYLGETPKYLGAPSFAYEIKTGEETYVIDRQGVIKSSQGALLELNDILNGEHLEENEVQVIEEKTKGIHIDCLEVGFPFEEHTGRTLVNIVNMLYSKQHLLIKALGITSEPFIDKTFIEKLDLVKIETIKEFEEAITRIGVEGCKGIIFDFEEETLTFRLPFEDLSPDSIEAFKEITVRINELSLRLKRTFSKQAQADNPKYIFRTWLIRLGMIGDEYIKIRKTLMSNLEGNSSYRKISEERQTEVNG